MAEANPFKELDEPWEEFNETFPMESKQDNRQEIVQQNSDYLDEYKNSQNNKYTNSEPLMFNEDSRTDNLVIWQLRVDWNRVEHIIRGHKPKIDDGGNEYFVKIEDHYLNEYGVNSILHFLSFYLSKEIFLGRYSKEQVQLILKQFSKKFINWFFNNLQEFGMDTPRKRKMAPMFVQAVIDLVDASYSRAIEGKTADLINKQFSVMQNQPLENISQFQQPTQRKGVLGRMFG